MNCVKSYVVEHAILNISLKAFSVTSSKACLIPKMEYVIKSLFYGILHLGSSYVNIKIIVFPCVEFI